MSRTSRTLGALLDRSVAEHAGSPLLSQAGRTLTYAEVGATARSRAGFLLAAGVQPRERVLILDEDHLQTALWVLACVRAGAFFGVLHRSTRPARMTQIIADAAPAAVVDTGATRDDCYDRQALLRIAADPPPARDRSAGETAGFHAIETDPALLVYTSGSTGLPKGIVCPHGSAVFAVESINSYLGTRAGDTIGSLLPLSFDYGLYQLFLALDAGASLAFIAEERSPLALVQRLREARVTIFPALPAVLVALARLSAMSIDLPDLRLLTNTGDALSPVVIDKLRALLPEARLFSMYGLSECKRALYLPPEKLAEKPASVGRPIPGTRAYVVTPGGDPAPPGEVGELVVEGPHVMNGYWRAPAETRERFATGPAGERVLRTGDLFRQDEDGDLYFVARRADLIKSGGFRVSPREIELVLAEAPGLQCCVVYGEPDPLLGQAICADVVLDAGSTADDLFAYCRSALEPHLVPTRIRLLDELRRTCSGKFARVPVAQP
jgi:amino acid adenylation domain-containing protein